MTGLKVSEPRESRLISWVEKMIDVQFQHFAAKRF